METITDVNKRLNEIYQSAESQEGKAQGTAIGILPPEKDLGLLFHLASNLCKLSRRSHDYAAKELEALGEIFGAM